MIDSKIYEELYKNMYEYMINKDINSLSTLLSDDFILIHMTGMHQSKQEFLDAINDGTLNYFFTNHENIMISEKTNVIELIGQSIVEAAVFGGSKNTWKLELTLTILNNQKPIIKQIKASTY